MFHYFYLNRCDNRRAQSTAMLSPEETARDTTRRLSAAFNSKRSYNAANFDQGSRCYSFLRRIGLISALSILPSCSRSIEPYRFSVWWEPNLHMIPMSTTLSVRLCRCDSVVVLSCRRTGRTSENEALRFVEPISNVCSPNSWQRRRNVHQYVTS